MSQDRSEVTEQVGIAIVLHISAVTCGSNVQTTNLGVRSSNLFGRAKKSGILRTDMSLGKRSRDSQETLHARRPFKCNADVVRN